MHPDVDNEDLYLANLTLDTTGVFRGIIHLEDMQTQGMLANVDCSPGSLQLHFENVEHLEAAEHQWQVGVQESEDQDYIVIVGQDQCGIAAEVGTVTESLLHPDRLSLPRLFSAKYFRRRPCFH